MSLVVTATSAGLPVTLTEAKEHLRVFDGDSDGYINTLIATATEYCEAVTGRALRVSQAITQAWSDWPSCGMNFDRQPVTEIDELTYFDEAGVEQTVNSSLYRLIGSTNAAAKFEFDSNFTYPTLFERSDAVQMAYVAGYGSIAAVPSRAKHAIKLLIGHWFEHGEAVSVGSAVNPVDMAVESLLGSLDWGCYR